MLVFGSVIVFFCDLGPGFFWDSFFQVALKYLHAKHQPLLVTSGHSRGVLPSTLAPKDVGWLLNGAGSCMSFDKGGVFRCESLGFIICKVRGCGYTPVFFFLMYFQNLGGWEWIFGTQVVFQRLYDWPPMLCILNWTHETMAAVPIS